MPIASRVCQTLEDTRDFARSLVPIVGPQSIVFLTGPMGAGKTTFINYFVQSRWDVESEVSSPTFTLENRYFHEDELVIHLDLTRLKAFEEVIQLSTFESLSLKNFVFVEWADRFPMFLWASYLRGQPFLGFHLDIQETSNGRLFTLSSMDLQAAWPQGLPIGLQ